MDSFLWKLYCRWYRLDRMPPKSIISSGTGHLPKSQSWLYDVDLGSSKTIRTPLSRHRISTERGSICIHEEFDFPLQSGWKILVRSGHRADRVREILIVNNVPRKCRFENAIYGSRSGLGMIQVWRLLACAVAPCCVVLSQFNFTIYVGSTTKLYKEKVF